MLIDPFYDPAPAYSPNHTGIIEIPPEVGTDTVSLLAMIKTILLSAGWSISGAGHSTADTRAVASMMPVASVPIPPRPLVPNSIGCTGSVNPQAIVAVVDGMNFIAYNPYTEIKPEGCSDRIFFPAGLTVMESADNLATEISAHTSFLATYTGITTNPDIPLMGQRLLFHLESVSPAWENDYKPLVFSGGGSAFTSKGYYRMRSQTTPEGGFLEVKLQAYALNFGTINENAELGQLTPFLTVRCSGGDGEYKQAFYASGDYLMCASRHQFAIWCDRSGRGASAMVASLPKPDPNHLMGMNTPLVYGSESYSWYGTTGTFQQVTRQLHWGESYATGTGNILVDRGWRTQEGSTTYWRDPTLLHRGLRSIPLKTVTSMPLVTSAYAMVASDPNVQDEVQIGGRLWDMIVATDQSLNTGVVDQDGMALFDSFHWMKVATATIANDLTSSLWVKVEQGGG